MSYPPPRYVGQGGEVTAVFRAADQGPDLISRTGSVRYLATGASTGGDFGLYRWDMGPEPSGAGPHFHRTMSESFFVLSGVVRVTDGRPQPSTPPSATSCTCHRVASTAFGTSRGAKRRC